MPPSVDDIYAAIASLEPELCELSGDEKSAVSEFALAWTYFEAKVSNKLRFRERDSVNPSRIGEFCNHETTQSYMTNQTDAALNFWSNRYIENGTTNHRFEALRFSERDRDTRNEVQRVLMHPEMNETLRRRAALNIVYRLRCNLMHGTKWQYQMQDQKENFRYGVQVLLEALGLPSEPSET